MRMQGAGGGGYFIYLSCSYYGFSGILRYAAVDNPSLLCLGIQRRVWDARSHS